MYPNNPTKKNSCEVGKLEIRGRIMILCAKLSRPWKQYQSYSKVASDEKLLCETGGKQREQKDRPLSLATYIVIPEIMKAKNPEVVPVS